MRRKLDEVDDALARLSAVRDQLHDQLTAAMTKQRPPACEFA
jgi:hypothetical protein